MEIKETISSKVALEKMFYAGDKETISYAAGRVTTACMAGRGMTG